MGTAVTSPVHRDWGWKLTTHLHLLQRLRMSGTYTSTHPTCLHGVEDKFTTTSCCKNLILQGTA
jgi:hypothetical protein